MTAQLSRERLDYLKERLPTRIKSLEIHEKDGSIGSAQQETLDAYRLALAVMDSEPVAWIYEDELPENYPYDAMFPYSKVDIVRMFPVFAPPEQE